MSNIEMKLIDRNALLTQKIKKLQKENKKLRESIDGKYIKKQKVYKLLKTISKEVYEDREVWDPVYLLD